MNTLLNPSNLSHRNSRRFATILAGAGLALALSLPANTPVQAAPQPQEAPVVMATRRPTERVMVLPFGGPDNWRDGSWNVIGTQVANMVTTALVNRGVSVVDRKTLKNQQDEMDLNLTGAMNSATVGQIGRTAGAKIIVNGNVTEFGVQKKGGGFAGIRVGKETARVKIDVTVTDVETSEILGSVTGLGTLSKDKFSIGLGLGIDYNSNEWLESMMGKAARVAVEDMANRLAPMIPARRGEDDFAGKSAQGASSLAANPAGMAALRELTCVVLIPETHLARPNVPDPAAETEITKQLLAAGIKVKDDARLRQLRDQKWVLETLHGNADPVKLEELKNNFGADILIVGEGISERAERNVVTNNSVITRGRVEVKAIRMDTAAIIAADDEHQAGRDLSEILSSKLALKNAAANVAPRLIASMAQNLAHGAARAENNTVTMEIEISGLASLSQANQFIEALSSVSGVQNAKRGGWKGGVLSGTVTVERDSANDLGLWLEENSSLKKFNLQVQDSNSAKVVARVKKM